MERNENKSTGTQAKQLMELVNTLSLFTRITMIDWLPGLFSELNLTEERYMAMFELSLQPDISLKRLAQSLMVSPSNLSVMINAMVQQNLVERVPDPEDRRRVLLRLSEEGTKICRKADAYSLKQFEAFIKKLDKDDRAALDLAAENMIFIARRIIDRQGSLTEQV